MAQFEQDLGKVGVTLAGEWLSTSNYERLTMVTWRGTSYVSKITNRGVEPGTNPDVWQLVAEKGADGQGGGGGGQGGTTDIGVARYIDSYLYWTKNGVWLRDENSNMVRAQGIDGKDGKDGKDGTGSGSGSGVSSFKSIIFRRTNTAPDQPTGGTFENPVATGWSDGIPSGNEILWMSTRWFYSDDDLTAETEWSAPMQATDTADIDFEYSSVASPGTPSTNPAFWHNEGVEADIWMATRIYRNGVWSNWSIVKIKGENGRDGIDGKDGDSFNILGSYDTMEEAELANPDPNRGDAIIVDGTLYVWDGEQWADLGVESPVWIQLSESACVFPGGTSAALSGSETIEVFGYRGRQRVATTIGTITGLPAAGMSVSYSDNATDHASLTLAVTTSLTAVTGQLTIPVTADGETLNLKLSWALALKGSDGATGGTGATGQSGYNTVNLMLYLRSASQPSGMPGSVTYTFSSDSISTPSNGWQRTPPASDGNPLWMVQGSGSTRSNTVTISSWNGPVKFVENGYPGKTMRGPSKWTEGISYQGVGNSGTDFVDLVYVADNYATLYYCKQNNTANDQVGTRNKPGSGTQLANDCWGSAEVTDFLATKLFFSDLSYIENLGVRNLLVTDSGTIVGGFMPANTDYADQKNNGNYLIWAGAETPQSPNAIFSVNKYGRGKFGPFTSDGSGFTSSSEDTGYLGGQGESTVKLYSNKVSLYVHDQPGTMLFEAASKYDGDAVLKLNISGYGTEVDNKPALLIDAKNGADSGVAMRITDGFIEGLRPRVDKFTGNTTLSYLNHNIIIPDSVTSTFTIFLPGSPLDGQEYFIFNASSGAAITISSGLNMLIRQLSVSGTAGNSSFSLASGKKAHLVYCAALSKWFESDN